MGRGEGGTLACVLTERLAICWEGVHEIQGMRIKEEAHRAVVSRLLSSRPLSLGSHDVLSLTQDEQQVGQDTAHHPHTLTQV